ncbi:MAG: type III-A CRISPR-associated RAMP protein Csm4 [Dysgonamonadaceae bacterium]|jgi:CRISPR type III-A-associated RAMP protein Csm4|nr:type III-A CRISPR-associated RAMP protein Csm4 [Dysgonamonadaceae bacterium]
MPEYNIIKLTHLTPLHIGSGRENHYDFSAPDLHSDTLSAALASLRAQQGKSEDTEAFLSSFTLSSAFPFWEDTFFLPALQGKFPVTVAGKEEKEYRKQLKNLKYIDATLWNEIVSGNMLTVKSSQLQIEKFLTKAGSNLEVPYKSQVNQRVSVPRMDGQDADPFFFNWTYYHEKSGLYCLTDAKGDKYNEIVTLFEMLGETGIGTDRNVGGGKFKVERDTMCLPDIKDANYTLLLSLYIPTEEEVTQLNLHASRYELLLRGGYLSGSGVETFRHLRKRSIYMFNVGSLFPTTAKMEGKIVDLKPDWNDDRMHPVYRSGRPFCLSIKINEP